jgi:hypothetical protein
MQNFLISGLCGLALVSGCKSKDKDAPPPPPPVTDPVGSGSAATTNTGSGSAGGTVNGLELGAGETYFGGKATATNLVDWKLADGTIVQLGVITTGKSAEGRDEGVLRAYSANTPSYEVGPRYSLDASKDHWAELKPVENNRVLFRYGADGEARDARNAVLLRWDADAKRVVVAKRWTGTFKDAEPAWLTTGTYAATVAAGDEANCEKVIAKMVTCEKDPKFREAMFKRAQPDARPAMQAHFDTHVTKWRKGPEAKAQCKRWATDDYVDTHFAEPRKLANLAEDTRLQCDEFAREVVDEGGLPVALTDAKGG